MNLIQKSGKHAGNSLLISISCLCLIALVILSLRKAALETTATEPASKTLREAAPAPEPIPESAPILDTDTTPAEKPLSRGAATRKEISQVQTSAEAAYVHLTLTEDLMDRILSLENQTNPRRVRVAMQELAERFYLLDRAVKLRNLTPPGPGSVSEADREKVEKILELWQVNIEVSMTVDDLFKDRDLLPDEHLSQTLRRWMNESAP